MIKTVFKTSNKSSNAAFGLMQVLDGLVRLLPFGRLATTRPLDHSRPADKRNFESLKSQQAQGEAHGQR